MSAKETAMAESVSELAYEVDLREPYEQAVETVTTALKSEGFGVLTRIDVKATLKEKLGADFRPYVILGACNPPLAHRALEAEPRIGVLLPCNVTVEQAGEGARVRLVNPFAMLAVGDLGENAEVRAVALEANERLQRVASALRGEA